MSYTVSEVLDFVEENDVKFVKLAFCDLNGVQKNISITAESLPKAFEKGISIDTWAIDGFVKIEETDLLLFPDLSTVTILPWRPQHGRVMRMFCSIRYPDGRQFEGDGRYILAQAVKKMAEAGYRCNIGTECEFYLFELDEKGLPTKIPQDNAQYCDIAPLDKGENVRRDICFTLEEMGIVPESSHHEQGPGQNEIDFRHSNAITAADNMTSFKSVVKTIARKNGLFASFMPKPFKNKSGNGLHVNISLEKNGRNIFQPQDDSDYSQEAEFFIEGILNRIKEVTLFFNPIVNSYRRLGEFDAPRHITWSQHNRSRLVRIPAESGKYGRMELRSPDPTCNPYIAFALLIYAGLEGLENKIPLREQVDIKALARDNDKLDEIDKIPHNLAEAIQCVRESEFVRSHLPEKMLNVYLDMKSDEYTQYNQGLTSEQKDELYFHRV